MLEPTEKPLASAVIASMDKALVAVLVDELTVDSLQPAINKLATTNTLRKILDVMMWRLKPDYPQE